MKTKVAVKEFATVEDIQSPELPTLRDEPAWVARCEKEGYEGGKTPLLELLNGGLLDLYRRLKPYLLAFPETDKIHRVRFGCLVVVVEGEDTAQELRKFLEESGFIMAYWNKQAGTWDPPRFWDVPVGS